MEDEPRDVRGAARCDELPRHGREEVDATHVAAGTACGNGFASIFDEFTKLTANRFSEISKVRFVENRVSLGQCRLIDDPANAKCSGSGARFLAQALHHQQDG